MWLKKQISFPFLPAVLLLSACSSDPLQSLDTPTSGKITIGVDESFSPVMEAQVETFNSLYKYAVVTEHNAPENQAFTDLMNDSVRLIVTTRKLREDESKFFESKKLFPRTTQIANDAIALIVNKDNTDTLFSWAMMEAIFTGKMLSWKEVNSKSALGDIKIVFDNANSGNARYIREKFKLGKALNPNCFAVQTNPEVINYVSQNKNAIGVIGVNWISDNDDTATKGFLKKVNVIGIAPPDTAKGAGHFYKPYQAYIAQKVYPLCREVYIVSREARAGLGTGFTSFVASDKGQRMMLKSGLVPATMPVRLIQLN